MITPHFLMVPFWQRLPKAGILYAMLDAKVTAPAPLDSMKKAEAAQMVATAMQGGGCPCRSARWPPEPSEGQKAGPGAGLPRALFCIDTLQMMKTLDLGASNPHYGGMFSGDR